MKKLFFLLVACWPLWASAQYASQPVFSNLSGVPLLTALTDNYKPSLVLGYSDARDTMYANIYRLNDSIHCVYSDHTIYLPTDTDPSTFLLMGGSSNGINTEHTYPRSKGAEFGNPKSDMHHLFPTRAEVNSARGNSPFDDIEDDETDQWFYKTTNSSSIPPLSTRDRYSEQRGNFGDPDFNFEPREDHKGNAARAIFYFYTMYRTEADAADPTFFSQQRQTLCEWHYEDPVDSLEWHRTFQIAAYQEDKPNPFVLDCSLPFRSYCADVPLVCLATTSPELLKPFRLLQNAPNPMASYTDITYEVDLYCSIELRVYHSSGKLVDILDQGRKQPGLQTFRLDKSDYNLPNGLYYIQLQVQYQNKQEQIQRPLIIH